MLQAFKQPCILSLMGNLAHRFVALPRHSVRLVRQISCRANRATVHQNEQRRQLLDKIYEPAHRLDKDSMARYRMSQSGQCWLRYHNPAFMEPYLELQMEYELELRTIDEVCRSAGQGLHANNVSTHTCEFTRQSAALGGNSLANRATSAIHDQLEQRLFSHRDFWKLNTRMLRHIQLPAADILLPGQPSDQVTELRNALVVGRWVAENAQRKTPTILHTQEIRDLSAVVNQAAPSKNSYTLCHGADTVELGDYRKTSIVLTADPLRIFPYPEEIPELVRGILKWRDQASAEKRLHPLLLACQLCAWFAQISPFPCGNGKVSRILAIDQMVGHGFFPILFKEEINRSKYLCMITAAQNHAPRELVRSVLEAQLALL